MHNAKVLKMLGRFVSLADRFQCHGEGYHAASLDPNLLHESWIELIAELMEKSSALYG